MGSAVARWKRALARYERHPFRLDSGGSVLLVIDMQRYFTSPRSHAHLPAAGPILPRIAGMAAAFRSRRRPVIFTRHAHLPGEEGVLGVWWKDTIREGTPGSRIDPELEVGESPVIRKTRYSAFAGTSLGPLLRRLRAKTIVICGVMTHLCCESTAREAFMRDYQVVFLMDATATQDETLHLASLRTLADGFAEVMTCRELRERLGWRD